MMCVFKAVGQSERPLNAMGRVVVGGGRGDAKLREHPHLRHSDSGGYIPGQWGEGHEAEGPNDPGPPGIPEQRLSHPGGADHSALSMAASSLRVPHIAPDNVRFSWDEAEHELLSEMGIL